MHALIIRSNHTGAGAGRLVPAAWPSYTHMQHTHLTTHTQVFSACVVASDWARALTVLRHVVAAGGMAPTLDTYKVCVCL